MYCTTKCFVGMRHLTNASCFMFLFLPADTNRKFSGLQRPIYSSTEHRVRRCNMLTKNWELNGGKTYSTIDAVVNDAPPSSTSPNPYKRRGFLRRKSPQPRRKFNLDSDSGGGSATGMQSTLAMSPSHSYPNDHMRNDVHLSTNESRAKFSPSAGSPQTRSGRGSPASSRSTSPHKRPWYPAGGRPTSRESNRSGGGGNQNTYVVHPTFRHLFDERADGGAVGFPSRVEHGRDDAEVGNGISVVCNQSPRKLPNKGEHRYPGKGERAKKNPQNSIMTVRERVRDLQSRGQPRSRENGTTAPPTKGSKRVGVNPRSSVVFTGHHEQLLALAYHKDILFSAAADGTAKVSVLLVLTFTCSTAAAHTIEAMRSRWWCALLCTIHTRQGKQRSLSGLVLSAVLLGVMRIFRRWRTLGLGHLHSPVPCDIRGPPESHLGNTGHQPYANHRQR